MFQPVDNRPDFPKMEHEVLEFWRRTDAFRKLQEKNKGNEPWSFIDGPITASNKMGVHHGWGRTLKDIYQRYHAMLGQDQRFQNGFDCQGLWVEVEVEKELGFNSKRDIEAYGLDRFARACRARVLKYAGEITRASERLGQWMDWDNSYYTMSDTNIEYIWYFLRKCHDNGWLYRGTRSMPWCWRCGTSLSQHELIDSYEEVTHRAVFLKLPLNEVQSSKFKVQSSKFKVQGSEGETLNEEYLYNLAGTLNFLLVWTTTPWTLTANVAAAVHPNLEYARVRQGDEIYYLSRGTVGRLVGEYEDLGSVKGSELVGLTYSGPFDDLEAWQASGVGSQVSGVGSQVSGTRGNTAPNTRRPTPNTQHPTPAEHRVISWDAVSDEEGTGIVHIAPGCGAEDFELGKRDGLPVLLPLNEAGNYLPKYGQFTGMHVTEVAPLVFEALREKGLLYRVEEYTHRYPVCWRCHTELVFRVATEWYIRVEELRPRMLRASREEVEWIPEYAGKRMENWLLNMSDWNISRKRYWGLVLPFYVCDCGEVTVVGTRQELRALAVNPEAVDTLPELHRPWVDEVKIKCPKCNEVVSRIPEVGDAWLDAGIVAFSTLGYEPVSVGSRQSAVGSRQDMAQDNLPTADRLLPTELGGNREYWERWFPADLVSEMREQIRLWFYSMLIMSVTLEDKAPYKRVVTYEKVHDEKGRAMHKSWGNAIWFDEAVEIMGADIMRWMYAGANTTQNMNFGYSIADETKRNLLTLWNTYSFFVMYANLDGWTPTSAELKVLSAESNEEHSALSTQHSALDRWILARLNELIVQGRAELDTYNVGALTKQVDAFVDDLSNWYVRRSRRRFWKSESDSDKLAAYSTLYEALVTLTKLIAPVMPFMAEVMYQNLVGCRVLGDGYQVSETTPDTRHPTPESVHHCPYPEADEALIDRQLLADTALAQRLVSLARAARNKAGVKVRQPLREMVVRAPSREDEESLRRLEGQVLEELNVKSMVITREVGNLITYMIKPNLPVLGPKYGKRLVAIRAALGALEGAIIAAQVEAGETIRLELEGEEEAIELLPGELIVETREQEGFAVAQEGGLVVALDTELDDALLQEGMARDLVRIINDMRKSADFNVSDRITVYWRVQSSEFKVQGSADGETLNLEPGTLNPELVRGAISSFAEYVRAETLADALVEGEAPEGAFKEEEKFGEVTLVLGVLRG